jgi:transposase InsO family protein
MIPMAVRTKILEVLQEALAAGARYFKACAVIGLSPRCIQRWRDDGVDRRSTREQRPTNKLSDAERQAVLDTVNAPRFAHLPPTQIVPKLADQGSYVASESTIYRILREEQQLAHRRAEKPGVVRSKPRELCAAMPNQVASWDITYLPSTVRGQYWYLYVVLDLFSRKAVAWQVYECEDQRYASALIEDYVRRERIPAGQLSLHADNGPAMKSSTLYATLQALGVAHSHSRPSVSDDNPFIESLFRTIKYRPSDRVRAFASLEEAREFADRLFAWYNDEHCHSQISMVTPAQRHAGEDIAILAQRRAVYAKARAANPGRWTRHARSWTRVEEVKLNPVRAEQLRERKA